METNNFFSLSINVSSTGEQNFLNIFLKSRHNLTLFVPNTSIWLNGLTCTADLIVNGPSIIMCSVICDYYIDEGFFKISKNSFKNHSINILNICNFSEAISGLYTLELSTKILPCTNIYYSGVCYPVEYLYDSTEFYYENSEII